MSVVALEVAIFIINNNVIQKVNRTFYCVWKFKMWLPWGASVTGNESEHSVIADRIYLQCKIVIHKYIDTDTVNQRKWNSPNSCHMMTELVQHNLW